MEKEIDNMEEEDFNIDKLLSEEDDSPVEQPVKESKPESKKKGRGRPKGIANKEDTPDEPQVPIEVANAEKDLQKMEWQLLAQQAFDGYQNIKTGEVIDEKEALRRCLCYAQEAARNSR